MRASVTPEDRFAVGEYASAPSEINGRHVPVVSSRTAAHIIVLDRTDAVDPLTGSDNHPVPDSKDAYTLRTSKRSAEIRTRSSATLYNVLQTKVQVVDEVAGVKFLPEVEFISGRPRLRGLMMDHHRLAVMGRRTAENRMWEVLHGFKDGDTMLSIDDLHT